MVETKREVGEGSTPVKRCFKGMKVGWSPWRGRGRSSALRGIRASQILLVHALHLEVKSQCLLGLACFDDATHER
jgi:hypothetical protein